MMDATNEDSTTQQYVKELTSSLRRGPSGNESVYVEVPTTSLRPEPWDDEQYVEELTSPLWREHEQYIQDWTSWTRRREQSDTDTTTKSAIATVLSDLHQATQEFKRNIANGQRTISASLRDLHGLPEDFMDRVRKNADADGNVSLTTQYTDYIPVMKYAESDMLRQRMLEAYNSRAYPENEPVLQRIVACRHEYARLLGYASYADLEMRGTMIGSAREVEIFTDHMMNFSKRMAGAEYEVLLEAKQARNPAATTVYAWERSYWMEKVRKAHHDFDEQQLRPYLGYRQVIKGVLHVSATLYDVTFRPCSPRPTLWHPSVECYEMLGADGVLKGRFYLDMHPRPGKVTHNAAFPIHTGAKGHELPEAALVCNVPNPAKGLGLMSFGAMTTVFHEFGHLLHFLFAGQGRWSRFGGFTIESDFLEAPSMMYEEWMKSWKVLRTFARHHETGQILPRDLVTKMIDAKRFGRGMWLASQTMYAKVSLWYHGTGPHFDLNQLYQSAWERATPVPFMKNNHFPYAFGHLEMQGPKYYTYLWSSVIGKDLFTEFNADDLLDPTPALRYKKMILAPGSSIPAAQLVHNFLGCNYEVDAFEQAFTSTDVANESSSTNSSSTGDSVIDSSCLSTTALVIAVLLCAVVALLLALLAFCILRRLYQRECTKYKARVDLNQVKTDRPVPDMQADVPV
uniref:Peptidase M3A/M3B catalytic domain-containing protein n=1 Tax=Eutreptiella gymnastica TaxID=73025 RepID=A0A7S4LC11_9EUGL